MLIQKWMQILCRHLHIIILCDSCGELFGHLIPKLAVALFVDANSEVKMNEKAKQIQDYELLVKQLKV